MQSHAGVGGQCVAFWFTICVQDQRAGSACGDLRTQSGYRISERGQRAGIEVLELAGLEANVRHWEHNMDMGSASRISVRGLRLEVRCWRCGSGGGGSSFFLSFFSFLLFLCYAAMVCRDSVIFGKHSGVGNGHAFPF